MSRGKSHGRRARTNLLRLTDTNRLKNARAAAKAAYNRQDYDGSDEGPEE